MRYDSYNGHAFIIGGIYKDIFGMLLYSKASQKRIIWIRGEKRQKKMRSQRTLGGTSKSMKANFVLKILENALLHLYFIIYVIVSEYEIKIQDMIKHLLMGARGQFLKSLKGKLDDEIPPSYLLADISH